VFATHEYRGWWWLPEDPEKRLAGTLNVRNGEAELDLTDDFGHEILSRSATEITMSFHLAERPRILGLTSDGQVITSEGHIGASWERHSAGVSLSMYRRSVTLVGAHFASGEKIEFDEISIRMSDLTAWTQTLAIDTKATTRKQRGGYVWGGFSARTKRLNDIQIPLSRGEQASIRFGTKFKGIHISGRGSDQASLTQDTELRLRFPKPADLERIFLRLGHLRNFLTLAVGRPVAVLSVTGYRDDFTDDRTKRPLPIELLWHVPRNPDPPERRREPREMLFTLPEASPDISTVLRSWLAKQKRLEPVFNLFFGMLYHPDMYPDVRFLMFVQAVETYGYRRGRKVVERPFADQVRAALANCPSVSRKIVGADEDAWVKWLKVTRDFYTHYNPNKEKAAGKVAGRLLLTVQLRAIIEMSLLRELGFTQIAIDEVLTRIGRYEEIAHFRRIVAGDKEEVTKPP
jgi:hypothetical protein